MLDKSVSKYQTEIGLIDANIKALQEGAELLVTLTPSQYCQGFKPAFQATIGAHFRHILEHYRCFLTQLQNSQFCYDLRERDTLLEQDLDYARTTIVEILEQLNSLESGAETSALAEHCSKDYTINDLQVEQVIDTNLARELLFLQSHTVHHYAIIAAMTRAHGGSPIGDFGVAIATIKHHQETQQALAQRDEEQERKRACAQ